jgi:hypothetical protein
MFFGPFLDWFQGKALRPPPGCPPSRGRCRTECVALVQAVPSPLEMEGGGDFPLDQDHGPREVPRGAEGSAFSLSQMEGRTEHRSAAYREYVSTGAQAFHSTWPDHGDHEVPRGAKGAIVCFSQMEGRTEHSERSVP